MSWLTHSKTYPETTTSATTSKVCINQSKGSLQHSRGLFVGANATVQGVVRRGGCARGDFIVFGCDVCIPSEECLIRRAVCVYATYRATNLLRHSEGADAGEAGDMLQQFAREGVRGHARTTHAMNSAFAITTYQAAGQTSILPGPNGPTLASQPGHILLHSRT